MHGVGMADTNHGTLVGIEDAGGVYANSVEQWAAARDKAWARLVKARAMLERHSVDGYTLDGDERAAHNAALQALRDLGGDVDALLEER